MAGKLKIQYSDAEDSVNRLVNYLQTKTGHNLEKHKVIIDTFAGAIRLVLKKASSLVIPPDEDNYNFVTFKINVYSRVYNFESKITDLQTEQIAIAAKLIQRQDNYIVVKFTKAFNIDWTQPSPCVYACLNTLTKGICQIKSNPELSMPKDIASLYNEETIYTWESTDGGMCTVCLDKRANKYLTCKFPHISVCSGCLSKMDRCPCCSSGILNDDDLIYI